MKIEHGGTQIAKCKDTSQKYIEDTILYTIPSEYS